MSTIKPVSNLRVYLPASRQEALQRGCYKYQTMKPCPNEHMSPRYARSGKCVRCASIKQSNKSVINNTRQRIADIKESSYKESWDE